MLFGCQVQAYVHLYPLWSAALQGNVERFLPDYTSAEDGDEAEIPLCRTNAVVESRFKSVKHGRLEGRLRLRPRYFVSAELKYVLGKVNERKMPKVRVQKKSDSCIRGTVATTQTYGSVRRPRHCDSFARQNYKTISHDIKEGHRDR